MEIKISMRTRDKKAFAEGIFSNGTTIVKAGGRISPVFRGLKSVESLRLNREIVDDEGNIKKDCVFSSPSTAAQFVNGNISNGFRVWKVNGENLGLYLKRVEEK